MKYPLLFVLLLSLLASCGGDNAYLWPDASGKPGEMVLTVDDNKWKSDVGDSLRAVFEQPVYGLPQEEPCYDVLSMPNNAFTSIFETHRNIVRVRISPKNKENSIKIKRDVWARPQILIEIKAKNDSAFHSMFSKSKENILDSLMLTDRKNYVRGFKKFSAHETRRNLQQKGIDLDIPKGFALKSKKKDFIWISHETTAMKQGLLVFFYDYTDTAQFHKDILLAQIDSVLKVNVPGPNEGTYMETDEVIEPLYTKYLTNNNYTVELRGLWSTYNFPMGGSYVAKAIPEVQRNRITVLIGFVFAPKLGKRNYQRQLEAIMSTIRFVSTQPVE